MSPGPSLKVLHPTLPKACCAACPSGESQRERRLCLACSHQLMYMDLHGLISCLHAHGFLPICPSRASIETKECVPSLKSSAVGPWGTKSILSGKRGPAGVQRRQGPQGGSPAIYVGQGLEPTFSPLTALRTHFFCPFSFEGLAAEGGGSPGSPVLLLCYLAMSWENRQVWPRHGL